MATFTLKYVSAAVTVHHYDAVHENLVWESPAFHSWGLQAVELPQIQFVDIDISQQFLTLVIQDIGSSVCLPVLTFGYFHH